MNTKVELIRNPVPTTVLARDMKAGDIGRIVDDEIYNTYAGMVVQAVAVNAKLGLVEVGGSGKYWWNDLKKLGDNFKVELLKSGDTLKFTEVAYL